MRKRFYATMILSLLLMQIILPLRSAAAGSMEWQLRWQNDGTLQEEIHISGPNLMPADSNWNTIPEGDRYTLSRAVKNWGSYEQMQDKLPVQVQTKNYFIFKKVEIITDPESASGLFQFINDADKINLSITVPGFIIGSSGEKIGESTAKWTVNHAELLQNQKLMTVITVNGLLLGIGILIAGLLIVAGIFFRYLRKANRIIEEEYALAKIKTDPPDAE
jgi:hypothetical protein